MRNIEKKEALFGLFKMDFFHHYLELVAGVLIMFTQL